MSTDVENVVALQESMRQQFRTLRPSIFPKQFAHFRDARNLANSAEGRAIIDDVLKRNAARAKKELGAEKVFAIVQTRLNIHSARFEVEGIAFVGPDDAAALNLEHVLQANQNDVGQAKMLAERFIAANGLRLNRNSGELGGGDSDDDDSDTSEPAGGLSSAALAHECYTTAYTLKVLASNMHLRPVALVKNAQKGKPQRVSLPLKDTDTMRDTLQALCDQGKRR